MTAPTSPKPTTPADPNDLRTALTKLKTAMLGTTDGDLIDPDSEIPAGEMYRLAAEALPSILADALLAAHPAPETDEGDSGHVLFNRVPFPPECSCGTRMPDGNVQDNFNQHLADVAAPAPVSGARRGDVERMTPDQIEIAESAAIDALQDDENEGLTGFDLGVKIAHAVLAVLSAPPAVEEAQVRERIAQDIEAVDPIEWALAGQRAGEGAARIARGATR